MIPVLMSGGVGSRLWPLSRTSFPKQFLSIDGKSSLLQNSLTRIYELKDEIFSGALVVCQESQRFLVAEHIRHVSVEPTAIILEPEPKNTAAAIAACICWANINNTDEVMCVFPSDHQVSDLAAFEAALLMAKTHAEKGSIVTLGVVPDRPEIGFGYIKANLDSSENVFDIDHFIEKPHLSLAKQLLEDKGCFWNAGIFIFKPSVMYQEFLKFCPDILLSVESSVNMAVRDPDFFRLNPEMFSLARAASIDVEVMQKTKLGKVVPLDAGWTDVGSWFSWWELSNPDSKNNVFAGDVIAKNTSDALIYAESRLVAVLGLNDIVIIETPDAILAMPKSQSQNLKLLIEELVLLNRKELFQSKKTYRPWGSFESLASGLNYQVKRLYVEPHGRLSHQYHNYRAEHWVVVQGTARVTVGEQTFFLNENESTYIPRGVAHRLENPGEKLLKVIEVQSGDYLGEDDIVRIKDQYGRVLD